MHGAVTHKVKIFSPQHRKESEMQPVRINTAAIPKIELRIFCATIADLAERLMADPKCRAEYEQWKKERDEQRGTRP